MVRKLMRTVICYHSYSGNTEEVAEIIRKSLVSAEFSVDTHRIGTSSVPSMQSYDLIFVGTFTWGQGQTPEEVLDFVYEIGYKPKNVAVFGTGDTQFGGDVLFCKAAEKLHKFYESEYPLLKIEQSPRGHQKPIVQKWVKNIIKSQKEK